MNGDCVKIRVRKMEQELAFEYSSDWCFFFQGLVILFELAYRVKVCLFGKQEFSKLKKTTSSRF